MARDDDEADLDAREWPDEFGQDSEPDLIDCPYCGSPISEEAEICPHCHSFVNIEDAAPASRPWWIWLALVAALAAVVMWVLV